MSNITISFETFPVKTKELKTMETKFIVIDDG